MAKPWPLCSGTPQEQIALELRPTSSRDILVKCEVLGCDKDIKLSAMRLHVGAHILRGHCAPANGMTPLNAEACGFCGNVCFDRNCGNCKVDLVNGAKKPFCWWSPIVNLPIRCHIELWKKVQLPIHAPTDLFHVKYA